MREANLVSALALLRRWREAPSDLVARAKTHYQWRKENRDELFVSRLAIRTSAFALVLAIVGTLAFPGSSSAVVYTWTQTNWNGGVGSSTATQYSSATNIDASANGSFELSNTEKFANTTFDSDLSSWSTDESVVLPSVLQTAFTNQVASSVTTLTSTFPRTPTQGSMLVAVVNHIGAPGAFTFAGWTQAAQNILPTNSATTTTFYKVAGASEPTTVTPTWTTARNVTQFIYEVTGVDTVNPVDQVASATHAAATSFTIPPVTQSTRDKSLAITGISLNSGSGFTSINSGFTNVAVGANSVGYSAYKELSGKQAVSATIVQGTARAGADTTVILNGAKTSQTNAAVPLVRQSASNAYTASNGATTTFVNAPVQGNTLFAVISTTGAPGGFTTPSGWSQVIAPQSSTGNVTALFTKIAGASEPSSVTFTLGTASTGRMDIYEARGILRASAQDQSTSFINTSTNPVAFSTPISTSAPQLAIASIGAPNNTGLPTGMAAQGFTLATGSSTTAYMTSGFRYLPTAQTVSLSLVNGVPRINNGFIVTFKAGESYVASSRDTTTKRTGAASAKVVSSPWATGRFSQSINVGDTESYRLSAHVRTDGSAVTSADASLYYNGTSVATTYTDAGSGWYQLTADVVGANESRDYGVQVETNKTAFIDDVSLNRYELTGTLTSNIFDTDRLSDWGQLRYTSSGSGTVEVRARTSNSATMVGAPNFNTCGVITSGDDISAGTNGCVTDAEQYIQYQVILLASSNQTPVFEDIEIDYEGSDQTAPDTNASNIEMYKSDGGDSVALGDWTNSNTPYFTWTAGVDNAGGIGVTGYCLYLGQDETADPVTTKGLLGTGTYDTEGTCPFAVEEEFLDLTAANMLATQLTTDDDEYYLNIKAIDRNFNVFQNSSESFEFKFDNTAPSNPAYIGAPSNFISTKTATLSWPTSTGDSPQDSNSGVAGLQYKIGPSGTWYGDNHTGDGDFSDLLANDGSYTTQSNPDFANLIEGSNVIYFRTYDNAGNVSPATVTTVLKVNTAGAPSAPQNITATPPVNTDNAFEFSWIAPATYVGSASNLTYCYTVNVFPTANNCTFTAPGQLSLSEGAYATQPGENTLYVVARDESSAINYSTAGSVSFTANTAAPGIPLNPDIADTSVRATSNWRLVVSWEAPTDLGAGVSTYEVFRSSDGTTFSKAGNTSGSSYVDTALSQNAYYYKIRACDSANNCGAFSQPVDKTPTGRYTSPPLLTNEGGVPYVSNIKTRGVTIGWSTDREADSKVAFGIKSGEYGATEAYRSNQTTDHQLILDNLSPGTTYYFVVRWTDTDGNTGQSSELVFETLPPPTVQDVGASSIGLTSATIQYTTSGASAIKLYYGTTNGFGAVIDAQTSTNTSTYLAQLKDLQDGTKYFYKVNPIDATGFEYDGTTITFETPPAPRITNLRFQPVENEPSSTQLVSWETNVPSTSELAYGIVGGETLTALDTSMTTTHEMVITDLVDDSIYTLIARSRDVSANVASSDAQTFRTALDTRPPAITEISVVPSIRGTGSEARGQIIVSWRTDEPATSQVAYGEGASGDLNNNSAQDSRLTYDHAVVISDLSTSKVYRIQPLSFDRGNNAAKGDSQTAIIGRGTESALGIIFSVLQKIFGVGQ